MATDESSVMFNLRELWQLQGEREAEERARSEAEAQAQLVAAQRAREAEAEQALRAQAEAAERAREAQALVQRAQVEREAALLRVQLEAAAAERSQAAQHQQAHVQQVEQVSARVASEWRRRTVGILAACGLCAAGATWSLQQVYAAMSSAKHALETQQRENAELRAKLQQALNENEAQAVQAPASVDVQPAAAGEKAAKTRTTQHTRGRAKPHRTPHSATHESDLGADSSDPIEGL
jgi:hypothetical protein